MRVSFSESLQFLKKKNQIKQMNKLTGKRTKEYRVTIVSDNKGVQMFSYKTSSIRLLTIRGTGSQLLKATMAKKLSITVKA